MRLPPGWKWVAESTGLVVAGLNNSRDTNHEAVHTDHPLDRGDRP